MTVGEWMFNAICLPGGRYAHETCWVMPNALWVPLMEGACDTAWPIGFLGDWARFWTYTALAHLG